MGCTVTVPIRLRRPVRFPAVSRCPATVANRPGDGQVAKLVRQQAADGFRILGVDSDTEQLLELLRRQPGADPRLAASAIVLQPCGRDFA
jgi:hypothetical protein